MGRLVVDGWEAFQKETLNWQIEKPKDSPGLSVRLKYLTINFIKK